MRPIRRRRRLAQALGDLQRSAPASSAPPAAAARDRRLGIDAGAVVGRRSYRSCAASMQAGRGCDRWRRGYRADAIADAQSVRRASRRAHCPATGARMPCFAHDARPPEHASYAAAHRLRGRTGRAPARLRHHRAAAGRRDHAVAQRLGLECEPWSNPTGMILTFSDPQRPPGEQRHHARDPPAAGRERPVQAGRDRPHRRGRDGRRARAWPQAHAAHARAGPPAQPRRRRRCRCWRSGWRPRRVAGLLRLPWLDIGTAGADRAADRRAGAAVASTRPRLKEACDAIAGAGGRRGGGAGGQLRRAAQPEHA